MDSRTESFMSIADVFLPGGQEKSYEEVRTADYLKSYQTTGRPPQPILGAPPFVPRIVPCAHAPEPSLLPDAQIFTPFKNDAGEMMHSIVSLDKYSAFCFEELRYYAYLKGNKTLPSNAISSGGTLLPQSNETLMAIAAQPQYSRHSFEELRVAYLKAGRQLTSDEISPPVSKPPAPALISPQVTAPPAMKFSFSGTSPGAGLSTPRPFSFTS